MTEFRLPSLGENIESGQIVGILVSVDDIIEKQQPILELETDKAVIEVPSPIRGRIQEIHVKEGQQAVVGQLILTWAQDMTASARETEPAGRLTDGRVVTGSSPKPRPGLAKASPEAGPIEGQVRVAAERQDAGEGKPDDEVVDLGVAVGETASEDRQPAVAAAPSVRRFSREIGVDIRRVPGSGIKGRLSVDDVKAYARKWRVSHEGMRRPALEPLPDFGQWGELEIRDLTNVRRITAEHMTRSWTTVPHVTQHDAVDITALEERRRRYARKADAAGGKLTLTAILLKVAAAALKRFPEFNASIDIVNHKVVYKKYIHMGVAVETERGLLVPVIRDVDRHNILQLSTQLTEVAEKARNGKLRPEEMKGGTFTITNLGGIGGTAFTPIVNWPEVAILGISRSRTEAAFVEGKVVPRTMLPLSLSYDHRLIDGAAAARFLSWVSEGLRDPFLLLLEG
ncbi:MAG: 2-oxo acid dehydrogenase subunit E2 [Acidobacteriota bacterium]